MRCGSGLCRFCRERQRTPAFTPVGLSRYASSNPDRIQRLRAQQDNDQPRRGQNIGHGPSRVGRFSPCRFHVALFHIGPEAINCTFVWQVGCSCVPRRRRAVYRIHERDRDFSHLIVNVVSDLERAGFVRRSSVRQGEPALDRRVVHRKLVILEMLIRPTSPTF